MKIRQFRPTLLILFLLIPAMLLEAQKKGYCQGYMVRLNGDTVRGWVKDRSPGPFPDLYHRIRFQSEDAWFRKKYDADDIKGYGYNGLCFESLPVWEDAAFFRFRYYLDENTDRSFLKVIRKTGPLTYYHWEYLDDESSYVDFIPLFHVHPSKELVRVTQGILGLKRSRLKAYFQDCPSMVRAIDTKVLNEIDEV